MPGARISGPAGVDLEEIASYLEREAGQEQAARVLERILSATELLAHSRKIGRRCDDLLPSTRPFPLGNYLVYYREIETGVVISRVIHGSRDQRLALGLVD